MNSLKTLAVFSILASAALAQDPGFFVKTGGGIARMAVDSFTQTTSYGETLKTTDKNDVVGFVHFGFGYQIDEHWDVVLSAADYSTAEVKVGFPTYPGIVSILPMPSYSRNVLKYDTTRLALIPSYAYSLSEKLRLRGSAGVTCSRTNSHFETTYYAWFSGRPSGTFSDRLPKESKTAWSYLASLGAEYAFTDNLSLGLTGAYSPFKMKVTPTTVVGFGTGVTQPSKNEVNVDSFEANLSVTWRK